MATRNGSASAAHRIGAAKSTQASKNRQQRNANFIEDLRESRRMVPPANSFSGTCPYRLKPCLTLLCSPYMNGGIPDLFAGAGPVFPYRSENRGPRHFFRGSSLRRIVSGSI